MKQLKILTNPLKKKTSLSPMQSSGVVPCSLRHLYSPKGLKKNHHYPHHLSHSNSSHITWHKNNPLRIPKQEFNQLVVRPFGLPDKWCQGTKSFSTFNSFKHPQRRLSSFSHKPIPFKPFQRIISKEKTSLCVQGLKQFQSQRSHFASLSVSPILRQLEKDKDTISIQISDILKGRGLFATRDIQTEEVIFYEPPLATAPSTLDDFCDLCLTPISDDTLILPSGERIFAAPKVIQTLSHHPVVSRAEESAQSCRNCDFVKYCSQNCQEIAERDHQRLCGFEQRPDQDESTLMVSKAFLKNPLHHLMLKIYSLIWEELGAEKNIESSPVFNVLRELDHEYVLTTDDEQHQEELEVIAYLLPHIPSDCKKKVSISDIYHSPVTSE